MLIGPTSPNMEFTHGKYHLTNFLQTLKTKIMPTYPNLILINVKGLFEDVMQVTNNRPAWYQSLVFTSYYSAN